MCASGVQAQTNYYWNGTTGAWNATDKLWSVDSTSSPTIIWPNNNVTGDNATFDGSTGYTVTVPASSNINVHNITNNNTATLNSNELVIGAGDATSTLTFVGTNPTIDCEQWIRFNPIIAGTSINLTKTGSGWFDLFGNNTFSGSITVNAGNVDGQTDTAFGTAAVTITGTGYMWWWGDNNGSTRTWANNFTFIGTGIPTDTNGNAALNVDGGTAIFNGTVTIGDPTVTGGSSIIARSNGCVITLNGPVVLNGTSIISAGTAGAGAAGGQVNINNSIDGSAANANLIFYLGGAQTSIHTVTGNVNLGSGDLTKYYSGTLQLNGNSNNWNNLIINEGRVQIGDGTATGSLPAAGVIQIYSTNYTGGAWNGQLVINSSKNFTISTGMTATTTTNYASGVATYTAGSNPGGLYLAGTNTGTVTLTGANDSFLAPYNVDGGALVFGTTSNNTVGSPLYLGVGGGANTGVIKIDSTPGGVPVNISSPFTLSGRNTAANAQIQNVSGNNTISGIISLVEGGNQYIIQSDAAALSSLTISGYVQNNAGGAFTSARNLVLQGTGVGEVTGSITCGNLVDPNGGTNPAAINVVKSGGGTWTLSGINTYTGTTTVNGGTLKLANDGVSKFGSIASSPQITVGSGAIFDVSSAYAGGAAWGTTGQTLAGLGNINGIVTDTASGAVTIAPGIYDGVTNTTGTLTFNNNLLLNTGAGDKLNFDLGQTPGTYDLLNVTGNLNVTNAAKVAVNWSLLNPTINTGKYPLIKYGTITPGFLADLNLQGSGTNVITIGRQTFKLMDSPAGYANEIVLDVSGTSLNLTWVGGLSSNAWDINTTKNWTPGDWYYYEGDQVNFTDTGSNSPNINLVSKLQPGSVTFSNSAKSYTLVGAGYLSGSTGLAITGSGKVTLANTATLNPSGLGNDFTGAITISSGTLQIGDGVTAGAGAIPLSDNIALSNNGTLIFNRPDAYTYTGVISGAGAFVQQGPNTVIMNVTNTYTGPTSLLGGTLSVATLANGAANSPIGASSNAAANLVLNGGTLQYTGAAVTSDRLFTLGTGASAGTLDASGTGALTLSNAGALAYTGSGARTLTLTGTNTGTNVLTAIIGNGTGGATSLYKTGTGYWRIAGNNTYSGSTVINNGMLDIYNAFNGGSNNIPQSVNTINALGANTNTTTINTGGTLAIWANPYGTWTTTQSNVILNGGTLALDDGHQTLASPVTLMTDSTISCQWWDKDLMITGNVTGTGNLTINAQLPTPFGSGQYNYGTVIFAGSSNNWSGTTTITGWNGTNQGHSTLQIGNAGFGSLPVAAANAISFSTGGWLAFNTTNDIAITNAPISGSGGIANQGAGTITLNGNNPSFTGTLVAGDGGGVNGQFYTAIGLTTQPLLNDGALLISNSAAVSALGSVNIAGANSYAHLEFAGNSTLPVNTTFNYYGRNPEPTLPAGLVNVSDSNTIADTILLQTNGNQYVIESQAGTLTLSNANSILNNTGNTANRYVYLRGAGNGVVSGIIGSATVTTNTAIYVNKSGNGIWTLNGVNTYTGNTTINGGTLAIGNGGSIATSPVITVNAGGKLDVSAMAAGAGMTLGGAQTLGGTGIVSGNITTAANSTLAPGNAYNVGTLTLNNNLTLVGGDNIDFNVGGAAADKLAVGGTMTFNTATTNINFIPTAPVTAGTYTVASAANPLVGAVGNLAIVNNTRYTVNNLAVNPNTITLQVSGSNAQLIWNSTVSTDNWATSAVWQNGANPTDSFKTADDVSFTDAATNKTVNLSTTVVPMSVTVSGTSSYNITGAGKISGATGFAMNGTGTVTLATTNDYYGTTSVTSGTLIVSGSIGPNSPVSITGGTLRIANATALGDNSLTMTASTTINGGTLDVNGNSGNQSLTNEPVFVAGSGAGGVGAIINTGGAVYEAFHYVTMTADATFGGTSNGSQDSGRWEIGRWTTGGVPLGYLNGNHHQLTKVGNSNVWLNNLGYVDLSALVINQGELTIEWDNALVGTVLGNSSGFLTPITVNTGGMFSMWGRPNAGGNCGQGMAGTGPILNNSVTLNGGGIGGSQSDTWAPQTYAGPINLTASSLIYAATPSNTAVPSQNDTDTYFTGAITGTGDLTKPATVVIRGATATAGSDGGTIYFTGSASNTYSGSTIINGGNISATRNTSFLYLGKTGGAIAIPHDLIIAPATFGTTVSLQAPEQIADTGIVTFVGATGNIPWLDLNGYNETIGGIKDSTTFGVVELYYYGSANNSVLTLNTSTDCSYNGSIRNQTGTPVLAGVLSLVKGGAAKQSLLGAQNSFTGGVTINGGTLEVDTLAAGGSNSGIGASSSAASSLILNGGALSYIGTGGSTDRLFTLGTGASAGTLGSSGAGAISWTNTAPIAFTGSGARTLTLTGSNTGNNAIAEVLGDAAVGSATSLTKSGTGKWVLSGINTYTGATSISNGLLELASTGQIATASAISTSATTATFQVNGGTHTVGTISGTGNTNLLAGSSLTATSVTQGTLTIGAGATLTIAAIPGGPLAGMGSISPVPEPATWMMLLLAAMGLGIYRRSR
ncbi:MAG: autotransporter-associated beta strand repeat-containing protein [Thermoguttaceae bacterium]